MFIREKFGFNRCDLPLVIYESDIKNDVGCIKLGKVRSFYGLNIDSCVDDIVSSYVEWRDTDEFLPIRLKYYTPMVKDLFGTAVCPSAFVDHLNVNPNAHAMVVPGTSRIEYMGLRSSWHPVKSVKRGNDVYAAQLHKKFRPLLESNCHRVFFSNVINSKRKVVRRTRLLYLTGTIANKKYPSLSKAWCDFGLEWNRFVTGLRDTFGKVAFIRTWQSQDRGYPHFHALMYFYDFEFTAVHYQEKDGSWSWRVHNLQKVVVDKRSCDKDYCLKVIKDLWSAGNLDVQCCDSTKKALVDILKYVTRDLRGGASDLTNALVWFFRKRSFAVSDDFMELFGVPGASVEPTDADLINDLTVTKEVIQEDRLVSIEIFPALPRFLMPKFTQLCVDRCDHPPDVSPEWVRFLDNYADTCTPIKSSVREDGVAVHVYGRNNDVDTFEEFIGWLK